MRGGFAADKNVRAPPAHGVIHLEEAFAAETTIREANGY
jgi:hypothetical protein